MEKFIVTIFYTSKRLNIDANLCSIFSAKIETLSDIKQ